MSGPTRKHQFSLSIVVKENYFIATKLGTQNKKLYVVILFTYFLVLCLHLIYFAYHLCFEPRIILN